MSKTQDLERRDTFVIYLFFTENIVSHLNNA